MIGNKKEKKDSQILKPTSLTANAYMDLMASKKYYRMTIAFLSFAVLILAILVQGKKTEIVVMPPDYFEPIIVDGKYANRSYIANHALSIALSLGNISSKNIDFVSDALMKVLSPRLQTKLGKALETEAKLLSKRRARQTFEVEDVMFRDSDNLVWVWGEKSTTVGGNTLREYFTYEFRIEPNHGMPKITHFDAYPGKPSMRDNEPVKVTPYLTRELALVKTYSSGQITISNNEDEEQINEVLAAGEKPEQQSTKTVPLGE